MKRIKNADINFKLNTKLINIDNFSIRFYTVAPKTFFIAKTQNDVIESGGTVIKDYIIKLDWTELKNIGEGVMQYDAESYVDDADYLDSLYNRSITRTTEYYIDSEIRIEPEKEKSYGEMIEAISSATETEIANRISADTELTTVIEDEVTRASGVESEISATVASNYSALTTAIEVEETRAQGQETALNEKIEAETTRASEIESSISGALDIYKASNDQALANEIARATSAETEINSALATEVTARENEVTRATSAESALNDSITAETSVRETADIALSNRIGSLENYIDCGIYDIF